MIEELKKDANNFQKEVFFHFDFHRRHPCFRSPGGRRLRDRQVCQVPNLLVGSHREAAHILCSQGFASFSTRSRYKMLQILCLFCHPQLFLMLSLTGDFFDFDSLCRCLHDRDDPQHNAPDPTQGVVIFVSSLFELLIVCCEGRRGERGGQSQVGADRGSLHILVHHRVSPQVYRIMIFRDHIIFWEG